MIRFTLTTVIALIVFGTCNSIAQTSEVDSLLKVLDTYEKIDSTKAQLLLSIAIKLRRINPNEAKRYYEEAAQVADIAQERSIQVRANNGLGICYGMMGDYSLAISAFQTTIGLAKKYNELARVADGYNGLGIVYKSLGDYPQSLAYYYDALAIYDSINDRVGLAVAYENVGILYDLMKEPDKSLSYYLQAIDIYNQEGRSYSTSIVSANIALLYIDEGRYDEALSIFNENLKLYDSLNRRASMVGAYNNIGHILYKQKKYTEAEELLKRTLAEARALEMKHEEASIYSNLFEISLATNRLPLGLDHANKYLSLATELGSKEYLSSGNSMLSRVYERMGAYGKALDAYKNHKVWSDSVFNEARAKAFKAQEVKVEVLEKNKQLAEQDIRLAFLEELVVKEQILKWLLVATSVLFLGVGILFYQKFSERKRVSKLLGLKNKEISRQKEQIELINYQLENRMLRAQINPHFIFNSLNSIQHFITVDDKFSALTYLTKFSQLLRQALESSISGNVKVEEELKFLKMYLELESLRFDKNFEYRIEVDESLRVDELEIPTMILQPIIENAIVHGLLPKKEDRKLLISFQQNSHQMIVRVEDNGIGREESEKIQAAKQKLRQSRGTQVTAERLAGLKEKYGYEAELIYTDKVDANGNSSGTLAELHLPMIV